jgi:hypothetical protein
LSQDEFIQIIKSTEQVELAKEKENEKMIQNSVTDEHAKE